MLALFKVILLADPKLIWGKNRWLLIEEILSQCGVFSLTFIVVGAFVILQRWLEKFAFSPKHAHLLLQTAKLQLESPLVITLDIDDGLLAFDDLLSPSCRKVWLCDAARLWGAVLPQLNLFLFNLVSFNEQHFLSMSLLNLHFLYSSA